MKRLIILLLAFLFPVAAFAQSDRYIIDGHNNDLRMRPQHDYDPSHLYRGFRSPGGDTHFRNLETGERLRGHIDKRGYGRLRDQEGNQYQVRPR